jgi:1-acyl-sn-glycerol-3-phosphate acyltransferase
VNPLYRFYWLVLQVITRLFLGLDKKGVENIPESGGAIVACNHRSLADPPIIGASLPRRIFYFAKAELFGKWYSSFLIEKLYTIPVKRGVFDRNALEIAVDVVKNGDWLLVFPEGTRSRDGKLKSGRAGAAKVSFETGAPIIPACITNSNRIKSVLFSSKRVAVRFGRPIYPKEYEHLEAGKERLRQMTADVMSRIGELIGSVE